MQCFECTQRLLFRIRPQVMQTNLNSSPYTAGKSTVRLSLNGMGPVSANWLLSGDLAQQAAAAAGGGLLPGSQAAQLAKVRGN